MLENQSIFILLTVFLVIYLGIFIRYYFISKSAFSISKWIYFKFVFRIGILITLIFSIFYFPEKPTNQVRKKYLIIDNWKRFKTENDLKLKVKEDILNLTEIDQIGLIQKERDSHAIIVPQMSKIAFLKFIEQFNLKEIPKTFIDKTVIKNESIGESNLSENLQDQKSSEWLTFFLTIKKQSISNLHKYLVILSLFLIILDLLLINKAIKI